jgi:hypothetical protein
MKPLSPSSDSSKRLVVQMAKENLGWGYNRIVGAMANLGHRLSDQTVGNILRRHDIPPAPERKLTTSWKDFIVRTWRYWWRPTSSRWKCLR